MLEKNKKYTIYVTKYALTQGIQKKEVYYSGISEMMCDCENRGAAYHGGGDDWHFNRHDAILTAEKMRQKKLISLEKKINKIKNMKFKID